MESEVTQVEQGAPEAPAFPAAVRTNGPRTDVAPEAADETLDPKPEAPGAEQDPKPEFDGKALLERLGLAKPETPPAEDGASEVAALKAELAELREQLTPKSDPKAQSFEFDREAVLEKMVTAYGGEAGAAREDAEVMLPMLEAALPLVLEQAAKANPSQLTESDHELLSNVMQMAQQAEWNRVEKDMEGEFGEKWPEVYKGIQAVHEELGGPDYMSDPRILKLIGHAVLSGSGQALTEAKAAGEADAVRKARRQAETTKGADRETGTHKNWLGHYLNK